MVLGSRCICGRSRLSATEPSILASSVSAVMASGRVVYVLLKKEDTWREILGHCDAEYNTTLRAFKGW